MLRDLLFRLRCLIRPAKVESELDDELQFHIDQEIARHIRMGLSSQEAMRRARLSIGGLGQMKDECRDARGVRLLESLLQDLRYGWRMLWRRPGFTLVAFLTLALGIGATTAIFSVVRSVLLRPLPFREPDRLVRIFFNTPGAGSRDVLFSVPELDDLRNRAGVFEEVSAANPNSINLTGGTHPE